MATTTRPISGFPTAKPGRTGRTWKIKVRDGDAANRRRKWLYVALTIGFMLTFIGWLAWLSMIGPSDVQIHDVWMP